MEYHYRDVSFSPLKIYYCNQPKAVIIIYKTKKKNEKKERHNLLPEWVHTKRRDQGKRISF